MAADVVMETWSGHSVVDQLKNLKRVNKQEVAVVPQSELSLDLAPTLKSSAGSLGEQVVLFVTLD